jgi:hypothetical protein
VTSDTKQDTSFLRLVERSSWRKVPKVWNEQLRKSLSDRLVKVGFGGVLELTDAGRAALQKDASS